MKHSIRQRLEELGVLKTVSILSQNRLTASQHHTPGGPPRPTRYLTVAQIEALRTKLRPSTTSHQRDEALRILGGCCACCGTWNSRVLEIDHIYSDGKEHRKEVKGQIIPWVLRNPDTAQYRLQLLCANCHQEKTTYGECQHQVEASRFVTEQEIATHKAEIEAFYNALEDEVCGLGTAQKDPTKSV